MPLFSDYLAAQQRNLDQVMQLRVFKSLVPPIDVFYERSLELTAGHVALIGRAQPGDSIAVTRRAIEAACLARAIKHDPENISRSVTARAEAC